MGEEGRAAVPKAIEQRGGVPESERQKEQKKGVRVPCLHEIAMKQSGKGASGAAAGQRIPKNWWMGQVG